MPRVEPAPEGVISAIPSLVGAQIRHIVDHVAGDKLFPSMSAAIRSADRGEGILAVAESFPLWVMQPNVGVKESADLRQFARNTHRWHHQIKLPDGRWAYARSGARGGGSTDQSWEIKAIFEGPLAERVATTVDLLEHSFPDDYVVRLLSIPAFVMNVFWIISEETGDQKVVMLTPHESAPKQGQAIEEVGAFLNRLRGIPPVGGLLDDVPLAAAGVAGAPPGEQASVAVHISIRCRGNIRRKGPS